MEIKTNKKTRRGFTLIELVISVFILSIAIVGIFSAFSTMTILTADNSDRLTATYLAQEGIETLRNIRDTNWLKSVSNQSFTWTTGIDQCITPNGCEIDYTTGTGISGAWVASPWASRYLYTNSSGLYNYTSTSDPTKKTKFKRQIKATCLPAGDCTADHVMKVTAQVYWDVKPNILNSSGTPGSIIVTEYFYNWF
ncbi:MAG: type II secretion system protein [Candidatus Staskawiczbacteria bacterium]|nr:type II secretion system protein [Candidatus Staskawiczbacteria bacterium]